MCLTGGVLLADYLKVTKLDNILEKHGEFFLNLVRFEQILQLPRGTKSISQTFSSQRSNSDESIVIIPQVEDVKSQPKCFRAFVQLNKRTRSRSTSSKS